MIKNFFFIVDCAYITLVLPTRAFLHHSPQSIFCFLKKKLKIAHLSWKAMPSRPTPSPFLPRKGDRYSERLRLFAASICDFPRGSFLYPCVYHFLCLCVILYRISIYFCYFWHCFYSLHQNRCYIPLIMAWN